MHKIIASGSDGNAVLYCGSIIVDCGVPFNKIKPHISEIQIILLTHEHSDHINISTIEKIQLERPSIRICCPEWLYDRFQLVRNVDLLKVGKIYDYGTFKVSPVKLYHDVPNCGYRIFASGKKIFHATDTCHLDGISAKDYDLYCLESNYDAETIDEQIKAKEAKGQFAYEKMSINSHLSDQQALDFFFKNKGDNSKLVRLHEHTLKM